MPDHRIQLRRAWQLVTTDTTRLDLPADPGFAAGLGPFRLLRRFLVPRFDPDRESLALQLGDLPGLVTARLDDTPLDPLTRGARGIEISMAGLVTPGARAILELEIDPGRWDLDAMAGQSFGHVALVIRSTL